MKPSYLIDLSIAVKRILKRWSTDLYRYYCHIRKLPTFNRLEPQDYSKKEFIKKADEARKLYSALQLTFRKNIRNHQYHHPIWREYCNRIGKYIACGIQEDFLSYDAINRTMVRSGLGKVQDYEVQYLSDQPTKMKIALDNFKESRVGEPDLECVQYNCSSNTLGMLYYFTRILELIGVDPDSSPVIIEFGGGFGALARIFKNSIKNSTIVILDLPELLCFQYLFLSLNFKNVKIKVHQETPVNLLKSGINLIPVYLLEDLDFEGDLFISTFALSESTDYVQSKISSKGFFQCPDLYITGLAQGRNPGATENKSFLDNKTILSEIRKQYTSAVYKPGFHAVEDSYELYASTTS